MKEYTIQVTHLINVRSEEPLTSADLTAAGQTVAKLPKWGMWARVEGADWPKAITRVLKPTKPTVAVMAINEPDTALG